MNILLLKNKKIPIAKYGKELDEIKKILTINNVLFIEKDILDDIDKNNNSIDMVVAIGGDGTIIKSAKIAFALGVPICGINAGHLGFLTGINLDDGIENNIKNIIDGKYNIDNRSVIDINVINENGEIYYKDIAINEVESLASDLNGISTFEISIENIDNKLCDFSACGLLVSTPTGSTGFSFSAGGPIVSPKARCLVIQPIYPHAFNQRAFVVEDSNDIYVVIPSYNQSLYIDGQKLILLKKNDKINVKRSEKTIRFVELTNNVFYKNLIKKMRSI